MTAFRSIWRTLNGKKGTVPICRNGPKAGTDAQRWSYKWGLSPFFRLTALLMTAAYWLAVQGTALAAAAKKTEPEEQPTGGGGAGWVISYALLILFVALGVFVVLKPSGRRDRAKPEQYGE